MRFFDEIWMPWRKIVRRSDQTVYLAANGRGRPANASGSRALIAEIHPVQGQISIFVTVTKLPGNDGFVTVTNSKQPEHPRTGFPTIVPHVDNPYRRCGRALQGTSFAKRPSLTPEFTGLFSIN